MFRWGELHSNRTLILSTWFYIPQAYVTTANFWTLMEVKTKNQTGSRVDPTFAFRVQNDSGVLHAYINWGAGGLQLAGPQQGDPVSNKQYYLNPLPVVPVGQWFKVTFDITQASNYTGHFAAWLNDTKLVDLSNVITAYTVTGFNSWNTNNHWASTSYSDGLSPSPSSIWMDKSNEALP